MLKRFQRNSAANRLIEEKLYEQVLIEMDNGDIRTGLWAKALANGSGSDEKAKGLYIKYRVQSIKDEFTVIEEYFELEARKEREVVKEIRRPKEKSQEHIEPSKPIAKKSRKIDDEYFSLDCFSEDSGYSIEISEKFIEEGLYPGKKINGIWCIHKSALSKEFLENNS